MSLSKGYDVPQFDSLIAASIDRPLPDLTPRDVVMPRIPRKADVVIGMRRSGKTYSLYQEMRRLLAEGVPRDRMLYMNLEDDRLGQPDLAGLDQMLETFYRLSPAAREHGAFIFLDEVQVVEGWSRFARRVLDTEAARLYVTGSSAKMLSTEVATEFRGRGFAVELLPFSFRESLRHGGIDIPEAEPGSALRSRLEAHLATYLEVGGFPDVQTLDGEKRIQTLQDYVELVLVRDVVERHGHAHVAAVRAFAAALLRASAQTFSVNKVFNDLTRVVSRWARTRSTHYSTSCPMPSSCSRSASSDGRCAPGRSRPRRRMRSTPASRWRCRTSWPRMSAAAWRPRCTSSCAGAWAAFAKARSRTTSPETVTRSILSLATGTSPMSLSSCSRA